MRRWRDGEQFYVSVSGTGSISVLGMTEEQGREAEGRKVPVGLRIPPEIERMRERVERETKPFRDLIDRMTSSSMYLAGERLEREIEAELVSWGECGWTARDLLVVMTR